jgi:hypothetical protein
LFGDLKNGGTVHINFTDKIELIVNDKAKMLDELL